MNRLSIIRTPANAVAVALLVSVCAFADTATGEPPIRSAGEPIRELEGVGFDQNLGAQLDLDLEFTDSTGQKVRLGQYFGDKPVIVTLAYYECPMLCTLELNGLTKALRAIVKLEPGDDFEILTVSFDPGETPDLAAAKKMEYLKSYRHEGAADDWHFLVGEQAQIQQLADTLGFRYRYDEETDLYRHASGIVVMTPDGKVSRYHFGVEYSARDLQFALIEASDYGIGSLADAVMLYCFHYDPATGKYGFVVMNALRLGGVATLLVMAGLIGLFLMRERKAKMTTA